MNIEVVFIIIFAFTLILMFTEIVHRAIAALIGAILISYLGLTFHVFSYNEVFNFIDYKLLIFVIGSLIMTSVLEYVGVFHFIGLSLIRKIEINQLKLIIIFTLMSLLMATFISNIPAMLIIGAMITAITRRMSVNPIPYLIACSIAINMGGTTLLISSIPNMLIASAFKMTFTDFAYTTIPFLIIITPITIMLLKEILKFEDSKCKSSLEKIDPWSTVSSKFDLIISLIIMITIIILFIISDKIGLGLEAIAISGATILLILTRKKFNEIMRHIDWGTIIFLAGFFIIIGAIEKIGILEEIGIALTQMARGNQILLTLISLWLCGLTSGVIDNIPVTMTLIPIIKGIIHTTKIKTQPLWLSLIIGANLGGNLTPIGSPSTVIAIGILEKNGYTGYLKEFIKTGIIITITHLIIASIYIYIRYYVT